MIILGLDPGTTTTGFAFVRKDGAQKFVLLDAGAIQAPPRSSQEEKLSTLEGDLTGLIVKRRPDGISIEKLFFFKNARTALPVSEARGVILLTAKRFGIKVYEYAPLQVKMAITGYGRASKNQVHEMVCRILRLPKERRLDDTSDAAAIALTAFHHTPRTTV